MCVCVCVCVFRNADIAMELKPELWQPSDTWFWLASLRKPPSLSSQSAGTCACVCMYVCVCVCVCVCVSAGRLRDRCGFRQGLGSGTTNSPRAAWCLSQRWICPMRATSAFPKIPLSFSLRSELCQHENTWWSTMWIRNPKQEPQQKRLPVQQL